MAILLASRNPGKLKEFQQLLGGFQLVPWSPSLDKQLGRPVSGLVKDGGGIEWGFGRKRDLGL